MEQLLQNLPDIPSELMAFAIIALYLAKVYFRHEYRKTKLYLHAFLPVLKRDSVKDDTDKA